MTSGTDADAIASELERIRRASEERERRLWEIEAALPAAVSRRALVTSVLADVRDTARSPSRRSTS